MALKTLVKVGEITSLSDARYCAGMGVELLGFNLNPDAESYVSPQQFKEITEWVAGVQYVGEFGEADLETIKYSLENYKLDMIQLSDSNAGLVFDLDLPVILHYSGTDLEVISEVLTRMKSEVAYYLFDGLTEFDELNTLATDHPIIVGADSHINRISSSVDQTSIKGIALKGSIEEKPGFKDYDQLADILEGLETED